MRQNGNDMYKGQNEREIEGGNKWGATVKEASLDSQVGEKVGKLRTLQAHIMHLKDKAAVPHAVQSLTAWLHIFSCSFHTYNSSAGIWNIIKLSWSCFAKWKRNYNVDQPKGSLFFVNKTLLDIILQITGLKKKRKRINQTTRKVFVRWVICRESWYRYGIFITFFFFFFRPVDRPEIFLTIDLFFRIWFLFTHFC